MADEAFGGGGGLGGGCDRGEGMTGSYAMGERAGRFFDNTMGAHTYSRPILEVGIHKAFSQVSFDLETFQARGGEYDWRVGSQPASR
ncbi:hypothetical protein DN745_04870 [Bradymonas sediminis]|uniref:Uncharacterized protein n=2 Tax=Bradymonas sediminis TaxID=1548548 RepID=A0A2Z4FIG4_9DELT|nr:hypothetical protein DN745_04870 [Bradymonas sediminis]